MKMILAGLGDHGMRWYNEIRKKHPDLNLVAVDPDPETYRLIESRILFYTSLEEALAKERPAFLLNVTPPSVHTEVNNLAFDHRIPVLCEIPISIDFTEAVSVVRRAVRDRIPLMFAENYRRMPIMRQIRQLITENAIGKLKSIQCEFYRNLKSSRPYVQTMKNPLLSDFAVHTMDLIRYFTDHEGKQIIAKSFSPHGNWFPGNTSLHFFLEMTDGVQVSYQGSLVSLGEETGITGNFRIEGTEGMIHTNGQVIRIQNGRSTRVIKNFKDIETIGCLDEFILSLNEKREPETNGADYLKTQSLVHFALKSSESGKWETIDLPDPRGF